MRAFFDSFQVAPAWRIPLLSFLVLTAACLALFHEALGTMVGQWAKSATYGHGFLIVPIALWLVWRQRRALASMTPRPSPFGLLWLSGAGLVWLVGYLAQAEILGHLAIVLVIEGSALAQFGVRVARRLAFPLGYLFFMVPFGDFAIAPLQQLTADQTTFLLRLSGIPVYHENWTLVIPGGTFLVAEACAGVRYLIACVALGALISGLMFRKWWKRILFMALSVIVPIIANVLRAYGIVMLAHLSDFEIAVGVDHLIYGFLFLSLITLVLIAVAVRMRDDGIDEPEPGHESGAIHEASAAVTPLRSAAMAIFGLLLIGLFLFYGARAASVPRSGPHVIAVLPASGGWQQDESATDEDWRGRFEGADAEATVHYRRGAARIAYHVAYYAGEDRGRELVSHRNSWLFEGRQALLKRGMTRSGEVGDGLPPPGFVITRSAQERRLVWYWYLVGGRTSADPVIAKLAGLVSKLLGGHGEGAAIAIATALPPEGGEDEAAEAMRAFIMDQGLDRLLKAGDPKGVLASGIESGEDSD
ncbi:MAG: exosortase A [Rhodothalassiaceae bacterium]